MLVISRKNGQKIMINDNIEITVVESRHGACRLAIQADKDVKIYREEIYLQIKLANLVGKSSNVSSVDSVSNLIKDGKNLNDKNIENTTSGEVIVDNSSKSIRINKKHDSSK